MSIHRALTNTRTRSLILAAIALAVGTTHVAHAAPPPSRISYQGLLSENGVPANGTYNLTFRFFPDAVGGSATELLVNNVGLVSVADGLFNTTIGIGTITDGASPETFTSIAALIAARSTLFIQVEVNGVAQLPRQQVVSAPYALNARRAETLDNISTADNSIWSVEAGDGNASLTFGGAVLRLQVGDDTSDALVLQSTLFMLPFGSTSTNQRIFFSSAGVNTAESLQWDEAQTRFEFDDDLAISGRLSAGSLTSDSPVFFHRIGTGTPFSSRITGSNDLFVAGDLEAGGALVADTILMRSGRPDGFAAISFREDGSDFGESLFWDDTNDRFEFTDELAVPTLSVNTSMTVGSGGLFLAGSAGTPAITLESTNNNIITVAGFLTLIVDSENLGTPGFVLRTNNPGDIPLLRINSTNEANLELDAGVTTNAFDFAEAFRPAPGHESLEPGDVVTLATGPGLSEHCQMSGPADRLLLGVVSTKPAYTAGMSFDAIDEADPALRVERDAARDRGDSAEADRIEAVLSAKMREQWKPIAMVGRVPTKVDGRHGPIMAGDFLTSSPTPGHAMKLIGPGMALGVALEDFTSAETGTISVFVRPMWHGDPSGDLASLRAENRDLLLRLDRIEAALAAKLTSK